MSEATIIVLSDVATVILSLGVGLFVAGMRWAEVRHDIAGLKEQVAEIKGMFVMRIRSDRVDKD